MIELLQTPNISPTLRTTLDLEEILDEKKNHLLPHLKKVIYFFSKIPSIQSNPDSPTLRAMIDLKIDSVFNRSGLKSNQ
jgi:hypothetical protein